MEDKKSLPEFAFRWIVFGVALFCAQLILQETTNFWVRLAALALWAAPWAFYLWRATGPCEGAGSHAGLITKAIKQTERALDSTRQAREAVRRARELVKASLEGLWEIGEELEKLRAEQRQKARLRNIIEKMQAAMQRGFDELATANIETQKTMAEAQEVLGEVGARIKRNEPPPPPECDASHDEWFEWFHIMTDDLGRRLTLKELADMMGYSSGYVRQLHRKYMAEHGPLEES